MSHAASRNRPAIAPIRPRPGPRPRLETIAPPGGFLRSAITRAYAVIMGSEGLGERGSYERCYPQIRIPDVQPKVPNPEPDRVHGWRLEALDDESPRYLLTIDLETVKPGEIDAAITLGARAVERRQAKLAKEDLWPDSI